MRARRMPRAARPVLAVAVVPLLAFLLAALLLAGCAQSQVRPGASVYRPLPFRSQVTITGNDVPGPLRVREVSLSFPGGGDALNVQPGAVVQAVVLAWVNGHGEFKGHWERDGEPVDRVSFFITYGESLQVRLGGEEAFPTARPGRHEVRFVIEGPESAPQPGSLTYVVEDPFT